MCHQTIAARNPLHDFSKIDPRAAKLISEATGIVYTLEKND